MDAARPVRIAIVEDEPLYRDLLRRVCSSCEEIEVAATYASGEDLIEAMEEAARQGKASPVDVLLTDIALGESLNGFQVSYRVRELYPNVGILFLSNHCITAYLSQLNTFTNRGFAYLLKTTATNFDSLRRAIVAVAQGGVVIDHAILAQGKLHERLGRLTDRQTEILHLVAQGYSNAALAESLHLSPRTVENHLARIYKELEIEADGNQLPRVRAVLMYLSARFPHLIKQLHLITAEPYQDPVMCRLAQ